MEKCDHIFRPPILGPGAPGDATPKIIKKKLETSENIFWVSKCLGPRAPGGGRTPPPKNNPKTYENKQLSIEGVTSKPLTICACLKNGKQGKHILGVKIFGAPGPGWGEDPPPNKNNPNTYENKGFSMKGVTSKPLTKYACLKN